MRMAALVFVACASLAGCAGQAYVVDQVPPARDEVVTLRPGYIWVQGRYMRGPRGNWIWRGGYYVRERPQYVYVQGRWERRGRGYVWIDGEWRPRGRVVVRER
jgi:hypothetical protein